MNKQNKSKELLQAIRYRCIECAASRMYTIDYCPIDTCPLYPFRFGNEPKPKEPKAKTFYCTDKKCDNSLLDKKATLYHCKKCKKNFMVTNDKKKFDKTAANSF